MIPSSAGLMMSGGGGGKSAPAAGEGGVVGREARGSTSALTLIL